MTNAWFDGAAKLFDRLGPDTFYAETYTFVPRKRVRNGGYVTDPDRQQIDSVRCVHFEVGEQIARGTEAGGEVTTAGPYVSADAAQFVQGIASGDLLIRHKTNLSYRVKAPRPDDIDRLEIPLEAEPA